MESIPRQPHDSVEEFATKVCSLGRLSGQKLSTAKKDVIKELAKANDVDNGRSVAGGDCFARLVESDVLTIRGSEDVDCGQLHSVSLYRWLTER